jgi:hypothetical protein
MTRRLFYDDEQEARGVILNLHVVCLGYEQARVGTYRLEVVLTSTN